MTHLDKACPFGAGTRASQCEGCLNRSESVPPCVRAWLGSEMGITERGKVIPFRLARPAAA